MMLTSPKPKTLREELLAEGPRMPEGVDYLFFSALVSTVKPIGFPSIEHLARFLHRRRGDDPLYLETAMVTLKWPRGDRIFVAVYTLDLDSWPRFMGWVYLAGGDRRRLADALLQETAEAGAWVRA